MNAEINFCFLNLSLAHPLIRVSRTTPRTPPRTPPHTTVTTTNRPNQHPNELTNSFAQSKNAPPRTEVKLGTAANATVMILDDDHSGVFSFPEPEVEINEAVGLYLLKVGGSLFYLFVLECVLSKNFLHLNHSSWMCQRSIRVWINGHRFLTTWRINWEPCLIRQC